MNRFISTFLLFVASFSFGLAQPRDAVYLNKDLKTSSKDKATYYRTHQKNGELYDVQIFYVSGSKYMDVSCKSVDPLVKHGKYVTYDLSGKKIAEGNYLDDNLDGRYAEYFSPSGKPKRVAKYVNGLLNGQITKFDSITGNLIMKCNAIDDKLDGKKTIFDGATGNKKEEGHYVNGILHGPYAAYDSISGARKEIGYYDNAEKDGEWVYYFKDTNRVKGVSFYRSRYLNGYCAAFHYSGNLRFEVLFKGGEPLDKWNFYYDRPGLLQSVLTFEEGWPEQMLGFDSATGKVNREGKYLNGKRTGKWVRYYPESGKISEYELYSDGKLNGDMETFYPSGKTKSWNSYKHGVKYDAQILYFEDGSIAQMEKHTGTTDYAVVTKYDSATRKPLTKGELQKGKKTGQWYTFYPGSDVVHYHEQYKAGMNDGEFKAFYSDGSKMLSGQFVNGQKHGTWNYYYINSGKNWIKAMYHHGVLVNDLYAYYENGDIKRHDVFSFGELVKFEAFSENRKELPYTPISIDAEFDGEVSTFIGNELRYPEMALIEGREGKVSVQFVVNEDGSVSDSEVTQSLSEECDKEALRVVAAMPNWKPATMDGVPFKTVKTVPVVFWIR